MTIARIENLFLCSLLAIATCTSVVADEKRDFFETKIRPVLVEHCYSCHSTKSKSIKSGLVLDTKKGWVKGGDSGTAIVPGKPDESLLLKAIKYDGFEMPHKGKLPDKVIRDFERWIRNGAFDPRGGEAAEKSLAIDYKKSLDFWAFRTPRKMSPPSVQNKQWIRNDIDRFVLARLEQEKFSPSDIASPRVLLRRLHFNLLGLPPTLDEQKAFIAAYTKDPKTAYTQLVEKLLNSKHYGERWARHWLDVARYGEDQAHTFKARKYPRGYLYRDWVVDAFNSDMPYDKFVANQIAGDLLPGGERHKRLAALGLFALGPVYYAENVEKAKAHADEWDDRIDTLMRGVLGLTVSCARCHDHKYDPISMDDYYGLAGIFASTNYQERSVASPEVEQARRVADQALAQSQKDLDRFLSGHARTLRPNIVKDIDRYIAVACEVLLQEPGNGEKQNKLINDRAKKEKLSSTLLQRWAKQLREGKSQPEEAESWDGLNSLQAAIKAKKTDEAKKLAKSLADRLTKQLHVLEPRREELFKSYGDDAAFVKKSDRTTVDPGIIPLGNLFDDSSTVPLDRALSTDRFKSVATADSLGVDRVAHGWGNSTSIAEKVSFDFRKLGSDNRQHGSITNDAWDDGGIRTIGRRIKLNAKRMEQGIGMHANALVTFDLNEIRKAGGLTKETKLVFKVDRAGLNDSAFGADSSAHLAVILSRPHRNANETDAILGVWVNGKKMEVATNDFTYYISSEIPKPILANGKYFSIDLPIAAEAHYLTLVTTGADGPEKNSINNDHTVFSGARLEMNPLPERVAKAKVDSKEVNANAEDEAKAKFLSRFFYDEGLLAVPASESEPLLGSDVKKQLTDKRKQVESLKKRAQAITIPMAHAVTDGSSKDLPIYLKGNPATTGKVALRGMPAIFTAGEKEAFKPSGSGRLELASSIASPNNPLTARVIVNRIWAGHFGFGLVRTPGNFGQLGSRPTHPQLLDYLTVRFIENGWSIKWLHREILQSATFQQSSTFNRKNNERDPENQFLWRFNRRRLEIEPWRDSLLAVTEELDSKLGGPSIKLSDANNKRRTLYGFVSRHRLDELLRLFDFPDPNITSDGRTNTTVPLQQLFVLNSDFLAKRAHALVKRLNRDVPSDDITERTNYLFQVLYAREADDTELRIAQTFMSDNKKLDSADKLNRWEQYALALLSANEFMYLD